jgi:cysteine desulfurase
MITVNLDANATTAPCDEAVQAVMAALWCANPSSTHPAGQHAKAVLGQARAQVSRLVGCTPAQLVFTSGATEANHMALLGALQRARNTQRRRLVLSAVEHAGLMALATRLRAEGVPVDTIGVDRDGRLDLARAGHLIGPDVALVSVMAANNETGVLMPIAELSALAHARGALLHCDATQLLGKHELSFADSGADLWSVSAHKLHGPKGVGALVLRKGLDWPALFSGRQERGRRGGTENLSGIAGFGAACERAQASLTSDIAHLRKLRDRLEAHLRGAGLALHVVGERAARIANTSCVRFGILPAEWVLQRLDAVGLCASSGAACHAGGTEPSHVQLAMGATRAEALAALRFSLSRDNTTAEIDAAAHHIVAAVAAATEQLEPA